MFTDRRKILFVILSFFTISWAFGQREIRVQVKSGENGQPVSFALITNRITDQKFLADEEGQVELSLYDSTLLKISAIGFEDFYYFYLENSTPDALNMVLLPKIYELKEFVLNPYPTVAMFKQAVASLQTEDSLQVNPQVLMLENMEVSGYSLSQYQSQNFVTIKLGGPITALYNALSRRARSEQKFQSLTLADNRARAVHQRYNRQMVMKLTGLSEGKTLDEFMVFCEPDFEKIIHSTDYELAIMVLNCYQMFLTRY